MEDQSMTSRLRAAVIGCGVGAWHAAAFVRDPDVHLMAACDLNPAAFGRLYERAQLPSGTLREFTDYRQWLEQERPDLIRW
jgi:predicted dehydrogenase